MWIARKMPTSSSTCRHPSAHIDAGWSSLEARRAHNPKVVGSNPAPATLFFYKEIRQAQIAQLVEQRTENPRVAGSIPALGIFSYYGLLAQAVEHLTFNQVVPGSSPGWLIRYFKPVIDRLLFCPKLTHNP